MNTRTAVVICTLIVALAVCFCFAWSARQHRYALVNTGDGIGYLVDRTTGRTWMVAGRERIEHETETPPPE